MACLSQTQFFKVTVSYKKGSEVTNCCGFSSGWNCFPKKIAHETGNAWLWLFGYTVRSLWTLLGAQKKRNTAIIMKITWYTKKKVETIMNIMVHQKSSSQRLWSYLVQKFFFRDVMKLLGQRKKFLRKVRSYFVNLLQNNKKFAVTLYLKSFLRTSYEGFAYFQAYWWCCDERATIRQK